MYEAAPRSARMHLRQQTDQKSDGGESAHPGVGGVVARVHEGRAHPRHRRSAGRRDAVDRKSGGGRGDGRKQNDEATPRTHEKKSREKDGERRGRLKTEQNRLVRTQRERRSRDVGGAVVRRRGRRDALQQPRRKRNELDERQQQRRRRKGGHEPEAAGKRGASGNQRQQKRTRRRRQQQHQRRSGHRAVGER